MISDLRLSFRQLRARWPLTVATIFVLGAGLALSAAFLAIVDGVLFKPLPFGDPDRLFILSTQRAGDGHDNLQPLSMFDIRTLEQRADVFRDLAAVGPGELQEGLAAEGGDTIQSRQVSPSLFEALGVHPILGRTLGTEEQVSTEPLSALISYELWRSRLGGRTQVVGEVVELLGRKLRIVGVMPRGFEFPFGTDVWTALAVPEERWAFAFLQVLVRLREGVPADSATAALHARDPSRVYRLTPLADYLDPKHTASVVLMFAGAAVTLLVTWVHAAGGALTGSSDHGRANAVLLWLGASRWRLIRQALFSGIMISGSALGLAWLCAPAVTTILMRWLPPEATSGHDVRVDARALLFASVVSVVGVLVFALTPNARLREQHAPAIAAGRQSFLTGSATGFRVALLAIQVTFATTLSYMAIVNSRSALAVLTTDLGFDPRGLALVVVPPRGPQDMQHVTATLDRLEDGLEQNPAIAGVARTNWPPYGDGGIFMSIGSGTEGQALKIKGRRVSGNYFSIAGIPLLGGTTFGEEAPELTSLIVSKRLAALLGDGGDVLHSSVYVSGLPHTVVGIVGDTIDTSPAVPPEPVAYLPIGGDTYRILLVRASRDHQSELRSNVLLAAQALVGPPPDTARVSLVTDAVDRSSASYRARSQLLLILAAVTLALAGISVHASLWAVISASRKELGVRAALGASPGALAVWLLTRTLGPVVAGVVCGLALGWGGARIGRSLLYTITPLDWTSVAIGVAVLFVVVAVVSAAPVLRAVRAGAVPALREL